MARLSKAEKLKMCVGCRDDFYNGNNDLGVKECCHLGSAKKVQRKEVGFWDEPPWDHQPVIDTLSCYHAKGYVYVEPHRTK